MRNRRLPPDRRRGRRSGVGNNPPSTAANTTQSAPENNSAAQAFMAPQEQGIGASLRGPFAMLNIFSSEQPVPEYRNQASHRLYISSVP